MHVLKTLTLLLIIWLTGFSRPYTASQAATAHAAEKQVRYLEISELKLVPNPFTPYSSYVLTEEEEGNGLRISFKVDTQSRFVWITGRILNTRGNLVRTITELEPIYSKRGPDGTGDPVEITLWWNGMTDYDRMAKNGRYIFHLKVSDSEAENFYSEEMASIVLIK